MLTKTPAVEHALQYAARGFPVFPCHPNKKPLTPKGFKDATLDPDTIRAWWKKHPEAMIGLPTGNVSGLYVIDLDVDKATGKDIGLETFSELVSDTGAGIFATTPSGGVHIYYRMPGGDWRNTTKKLGPGIDTRGDGGYVIAPPSSNATGAYEWADEPTILDEEFCEPPEDLLALLKALKSGPAPKTTKPKPASNGASSQWATEAFLQEAEKVAKAQEGQRNDTLNKAAFSLGQIVGGGSLDQLDVESVLLDAALLCGLSESEARQTIKSGLMSGKQSPRTPPPSKKKKKSSKALPTSKDIISDDDLADVFAACHEDDLRYEAKRKSWFVWDGWRWKIDETNKATSLARELCREAAFLSKETAEFSLKSVRTIKAVENLTKSDQALAATIDQWDADLWALNTPGGIVDLKTGQLMSPDPKAYCTKQTAVAPGGDCPLWLKFLEEICCDDQDLMAFLQRVAGYCLTGSTREHALFFIYGGGANGKSVFLNTLAKLLADYAKTAPMEALMDGASERHPTELAMLKGARMATAIENDEGKSWSEARIKTLTGGDIITARFMRQDFFEFTPQFKLIVAGNHKPRLVNVDDAIKRRLHLVPFLAEIPPEDRDVDLPEKLKAEMPGILRWAIKGCLQWQAQGLMPPDVVLEATEEYFGEEDDLATWISEKCITGPREKAPSKDLYDSYKKWAEETGGRELTQKAFSQNLLKKKFEPCRSNRSRGFKGIALDAHKAHRDNIRATQKASTQWE